METIVNIVDGIDQVIKNSKIEDGKYLCLSVPNFFDRKFFPSNSQNEEKFRSFDILLKLVADLNEKTRERTKNPEEATGVFLSVRQQGTLRAAFEILVGIAIRSEFG